MRKLTISLFIFILAIVFFNINCLATTSIESNDLEKVLRVTSSLPFNIDPAIGADQSGRMLLINLYDPLVYPDEKGEPQPHIAKSWEVSEDGLIWTFDIRKGIYFHDGAEINASDVKFSLDRLLSIGQGNAYLFLGQNIGIEVTDEYTIKFNLEKPIGPFLSTLIHLYIINEDLIRENIKQTGEFGELGDYGKEYLQTHDAGSGPYKIKKVEVGTSVTMDINRNYWIPIDSSAPSHFQMIGTTEPVTVRTLLNKRELEIGDSGQSTENLAVLDRIEGIKIAKYADPSQWVVMLHTKKPPTDCIHFRRAMAWATDYKSIVEYIFPGAVQARGPVPQSLASHNPELFQYSQNLEKARNELKQSKYYDKLDQYPVELGWCAEVPDEEKIALSFMSNMSEIGINVNIVKTPWSLWVSQSASMETSPNAFIAYPGANYPEAGSILERRYASKTATSFATNEWLLDPVFDEIIEDALSTIDKNERYSKYFELQEYIVDLCPTIFLADMLNRRPFQESYIDWYMTDDVVVGTAVQGYDFQVRKIKVYPEKREQLLKSK